MSDRHQSCVCSSPPHMEGKGGSDNEEDHCVQVCHFKISLPTSAGWIHQLWNPLRAPMKNDPLAFSHSKWLKIIFIVNKEQILLMSFWTVLQSHFSISAYYRPGLMFVALCCSLKWSLNNRMLDEAVSTPRRSSKYAESKPATQSSLVHLFSSKNNQSWFCRNM